MVVEIGSYLVDREGDNTRQRKNRVARLRNGARQRVDNTQ